MSYQKNMIATDPVVEADYQVTVFGNGTRQNPIVIGKDIAPTVTLNVSAVPLDLTLRFTPAQARELARHLTLAADATIGEPEIIDFRLYREPEAA